MAVRVYRVEHARAILARTGGEMVKRALAAIAVACICSAVTEAKVVRIEVLKVERVDPPATGPQSATPPYERLSGKFYGELDRADPKNALITDIQRAPKMRAAASNTSARSR